MDFRRIKIMMGMMLVPRMKLEAKKDPKEITSYDCEVQEGTSPADLIDTRLCDVSTIIFSGVVLYILRTPTSSSNYSMIVPVESRRLSLTWRFIGLSMTMMAAFSPCTSKLFS